MKQKNLNRSSNSKCEICLIRIEDKENSFSCFNKAVLCIPYSNEANIKYLVNLLNLNGVENAIVGVIKDCKENLMVLDKDGNLTNYNEDLDVEYMFYFEN